MAYLNSSRRDFVKNLVIAAPSAALACAALAQGSATATGTGTGTDASKGAAAPAGGGAALVAETDPTAKALGYVADGSKADRPKKGDVEGKDQKCLNCQLYVAGSPIGGKDAGKCLMITAGAVPAAAWCKSWMKKA